MIRTQPGEDDHATNVQVAELNSINANLAVLRWKRQGQFHLTDVTMTARAIASLGIDVARWYMAKGSLSPSDIGSEYVKLALRMVQASPTADSVGLAALGERP